MSDNLNKDEVTGVDTTGHVWDGIRELNNPLPRWWLWCFYLTVAWGVVYTIAYPAWPLINGATSGFLGYSTRANVAADIEAVDAQNAEVAAQLAAADLSTLSADDPAYHYGVAGGAAVFRANCSQCHGSGAAGAVGYPNLLDNDWLWGGSLEAIEATVRHGVRNDTDDDARYSEMPAFGEILERDEITALAEYVLALSNQEHDAALAATATELFVDNCSSCHGEEAEGMYDLGAPRLSDAITLYGNSRDAVIETITNARFGVMPAWGPRLDEAEIKAVTLYVHQLGGGE
ncbi:MAG: cytochrome-c oxidase, cbb3-type subunit III [Silicimonas sp.]|nr:cytochrome-c oxidase, cbb3-type subunit III [Silicimonas sp.]